MKRLQDFENSAPVKDKEEYERRLRQGQYNILRLQQHMHQRGKRAVLVFEGWDAGGKGGAIRRLLEPLDPRGHRVHPIGAPSQEELSRHYLWRFFTRLPRAGQLVVFDRSWYGRVLVERVETLCTKPEWKRAYDELNYFEKLLVDGNTPVLKFFLHISKKEQKKRFEERRANPLKSWKLTESDWRAHDQYAAYYKAINEMLEKTDTTHAPWHVVPAEKKWSARLEVIEHTYAVLKDEFGL